MNDFAQIFDKKELIELDSKMLQLDQKKGSLKKDDITEWLTIHYLMYSVTQLMLSNSALIPKNMESFQKHYQNVNEFEIIYEYLTNPNHVSLNKQDCETIYNNVCLELKNSSSIMRRIKIKKSSDGWLIKNKWFWNQIYILMMQLMRIADRLNKKGLS